MSLEMSLKKSVERAGLLALLLPALFFAGCTGSDVLDTGNTAFLVEVPIVNPEDRFDILSIMSISQFNVRPNDPAADAALGNRPIGILATTSDIIDVDFSEAGSPDPTSIVLSSGSYRISTLQMANLLLRKTQTPTWSTCDQFFAWTFPGSVLNFSAADLGDLANFTVPSGGAGVLTVELDATAFIAAFTNSWNCVNGPNGPIPVSFRSAEFKALAPTYLSLSARSL